MPTARISVRLQPRAAREAITGMRSDVLVVRVTAPPVDGKANLALRRLIARQAGVPMRAVEIAHGETSRDKVVAVDGLDTEELRARLLDA